MLAVRSDFSVPVNPIPDDLLARVTHWFLAVAAMLIANLFGYLIGRPTLVLVATILSYGAFGAYRFCQDTLAFGKEQRRCRRFYERRMSGTATDVDDGREAACLMGKTLEAVGPVEAHRRTSEAAYLVGVWKAKWHAKFARTHNCASSCVQLGILGTLSGGAMTVSAMADGAAFESTLGGLAMAFLSSVAGAALSLLMSNWAGMLDDEIDDLGDVVLAVVSTIDPSDGAAAA